MKNKTLFSIIGIIILLIIIPLLQPGYIFSLDQVLNPNGWVSKVGGHIYWVGLLSQIFVFLHIPIWVLEKLLVLFTFIAPAIGGYLLFSGKQKETKSTTKNYGILFAVLLLIFNPFLYARFLDGQINVYLSYSMYPLFFHFLKNTLKKQTYKNSIILGLWTLLLCLTTIHNAIFLFVIGIIFGGVYGKSIGTKNISKIIASVIFFNALWFVPLFFGNTETSQLSQQINDFGQEHQEAFKTDAGESNIYFNTLSLHGYWGEVQHRFSTTKDINPQYKKLFLVLLGIIIIGIYTRIRKGKFGKFDISLSLLAGISFILALGISENNIFSGINNFFYEYIPLYKGMREPQKWVMFFVIFYAYFGVFGINFIQEKIKKLPLESSVKKIILFTLIFSPLFYTSQMLWGFSGQISIQQYPQEWKEIKNILHKKKSNILTENSHNFISNNHCLYLKEKKSTSCYSTLSFPWHGYMGFQFTGKRTGGWIVNYFGKNILAGDTVEIGNIYTQSTRIESKIIEKYIGPGGTFKNIENISDNNVQNFIKDLQGLGLKNIILLKEADYIWYKKVLDIGVEKKYLQVVEENNMVILYEVL